MNRADMLTELRELIDDSALRSAWSETTLLGYLAEGQDKFCEQTGYFTDKTNFTIELEAGVADYPISDLIIEVIDVLNGSKKLSKVLTGDPLLECESTGSGMPTKWTTDLETGMITLSPTPSSAEDATTLALQVWRYSLYDLAGDASSAPEIPSRFQRACIEWAAYKAFMHHDMESQDPVKAADHLAAFNQYVTDGKGALRRIQNQEVYVASNPAYRT
jgi:hypothetical protein